MDKLFYHLAEESHDFFFVYALDNSRFNYINPACASFLNQTKKEIDAKIILALIHTDDRRYVVSKLKALINGEEITEIECRIQKGNEQHWIRIKPRIFAMEGERTIVGWAEDITVLKDNIEVLNNHNIKKNAILVILAHDLAGPIGTINNIAELLSRETAGYVNPKLDQYTELISKISKSSIELIRDFVNREFVESMATSLLTARVELVEKIRLAAEDFMHRQMNLNINFSYSSNTEKVYVEIDEDKFMQVINNLISNALKFTPDGGSITISVQDHPMEVLITIADNGIGIPEKYHAKLFDKFSGAGRLGLKGEQSTGLGLSIIKTIVEWHNGKISFESIENRGTTFYISLPKLRKTSSHQ